MIEKIVTGEFQTNTYVISNQGKCILVDPGLDFKRSAERIKEKYEIQAILLTHGHIDHIDGIRFFNVPIYIHEAELPFLDDSRLSLYRMLGLTQPFSSAQFKIIPLKDGMEFELIGYKFKVYHTPGHTKGSVVYAYHRKLLSGDTLFNMSWVITFFPTGFDYKMINRLTVFIYTFVYSIEVFPGHDEKTTIGFEKKHNPYL